MSVNNEAAYISWFAPGKPYGSASAARVGGKGTQLIAMHRIHPDEVPAGFCLTTDAYRSAVAPIAEQLVELAARGELEQARKLVLDLELPAAVHEELTGAFRDLGTSVAVRSSATTEDLESASFAGQQDTVLGVSGEEELLAAIRQCWSSLWTDRAVSYRQRAGFSHQEAEIALVIQLMVPADVAGVLFTADPVSGKQNRMLVSASYGLGESVVAAKVTPDTFTLNADGRVLERFIGTKETRIDMGESGTVTVEVPKTQREQSCLSDEQLHRLAQLGATVYAHYGEAQDIEWALCADRLYLLQTRPITTQAKEQLKHGEVDSRIAHLIRDDLIEHYPAPYPLDMVSVWKMQDGIHAVMGSLGVTAPAATQTLQLNNDGIVTVHVAKPGISAKLLTRLPRIIGRTVIGPLADWESDRKAWQRRIQVFYDASGALASASDRELIRLTYWAVDAVNELTRERFIRYLLPFMIKRTSAYTMIKLAGLGSRVGTEDLLADLDFVTAVIHRRISWLGTYAVELGVADKLQGANPQKALEASESGRKFLDEVEQTLAEVGARTPHMHLPYSNRSWREDPDSFLALIAASLHQRPAPTPSVNPRQLVRSRLPKFMRSRWDRTVSDLRAMHVGREGSVYCMEEWFIQARRVMDEIASRLVARGIMSDPEDIIFATFTEVEAALTGAKDTQLRQKITRRRQLRASAEAIWWDRGQSQPDATTIRGLGASSGKITGTARVIHGPEEFSTLEPGEVLVCRYTDPTWTPLFGVASAVVADSGGPLSHAAIVAREYGIPAVLGTQVGTRQICTGQRVSVDGATGRVSLLAPVP